MGTECAAESIGSTLYPPVDVADFELQGRRNFDRFVYALHMTFLCEPVPSVESHAPQLQLIDR